MASGPIRRRTNSIAVGVRTQSDPFHPVGDAPIGAVAVRDSKAALEPIAAVHLEVDRFPVQRDMTYPAMRTCCPSSARSLSGISPVWRSSLLGNTHPTCCADSSGASGGDAWLEAKDQQAAGASSLANWRRVHCVYGVVEQL